MKQPHCGTCGGVIEDLSRVSYRLPGPPVVAATERGTPCRCETPVVYGPPTGFMSVPGMPRAVRPPTTKRPDPDAPPKRS